MQAAKLPEANIETVRALMGAGVLERLSYLENNTKRVALTITRAAGYSHWKNIVLSNLEMIPTAAEKLHNDEMKKTFS